MNDIDSNSRLQRTISFASGANIVLGLWLMASVWIVGYTSDHVPTNNFVVGAAVIVLSSLRITMRGREAVPSWANALLGLWLIAAPAVFVDIEAAQKWNLVIVGALVTILALISRSAGRARRVPRV